MTETLVITEPGVYEMSAEAYHRHDSLSSSGARKLLPPSCPAKFRYGKNEHSTAFDIGHAAHKLVLGEGPELVEVDAKDWRTKVAQQAQADAYAAGAVPLLTEQLEAVHEMAAAIRRHPLASILLESGTGVAEQSIFWRDPVTDVMLRCRPDWLTPRWVVDFKTTASAAPDAFAKSVYNFGYYIQAPWYLAGLAAVGLAEPDAPFLFVAQEKTPPYLVAVHQLDDAAMAAGAAQMRQAIDLYATCLAADDWPGYPVEVVTTSLPRWAPELEPA